MTRRNRNRLAAALMLAGALVATLGMLWLLHNAERWAEVARHARREQVRQESAFLRDLAERMGGR